MEDIHRRAIRKNLVALVKQTNYEVLLDYLSRNDKTSIIPESFMRKWKTRLNIPDWTNDRIITEFYEEIQKRGPNAFELLVTALHNTGHVHQELARLLDPRLSEEQDPVLHIPQEVYNEAGENCLFIDEAWDGPCNDDRDAIKRMFVDFGFVLKKEVPVDNVSSFVVVNFHRFRNDGNVCRDEEWIHSHFLKAVLTNKPKILLSLRYKTDARRIETDSSYGRHTRAPYNDILLIKIYIKRDPKNNGVSQIVQEFINICTSDSTSDLPLLLKKLNQRINEVEDSDPVEVERWGFGKVYHLKQMQ